MIFCKALQASLFLTLLAALGSPVIAQSGDTSENSDRLFQKTPDSVVDLVENAEIAARLNRTLVARGYLQNVLDRGLSQEALVQLRDDVGIDIVLAINANPDLQPQAKRLLESINRASAADLQAIEKVPALVEQLGSGKSETIDAASDLMKIGAAAAQPMLEADPDSESGQLALQLLRRNPRLFRNGVIAALPKLSTAQQVNGLEIVGRSADPELAPLLLGYQFASEDGAVRSAATMAIQHLWDSGEPPKNAGAATEWLIRRAVRQLALSADQFQGDPGRAVQRATQLAHVATQIEPENESANAALLACRAAVSRSSEGDMPADQRERALQLALEAGSGTATQVLLDKEPKNLIRAMDLPAASVRIHAAVGLVAINRQIRGQSRARGVVASARRGSRLPEAVVIDPRGDVATLGLSLLNDQGYDTRAAATGQSGFDAAVAGLQCELVMIHTNCLRWPLTKTIANLRADARTSQTPIVVYGPRRHEATVRSLQTRYAGVWFLQGPVSELNFSHELQRLKIPGPRLTEAARADLIQLAHNAAAD